MSLATRGACRRAPSLPRRRARFVIGLIAAALLGSCRDAAGPAGPTVGAIRVVVATSGGDLDLDGYRVIVDSAAVAIPDDGATVFAGLAGGSHVVAFEGIADNCTLSGQNPRAVNVIVGDTAQVQAAVVCVPTGVTISATTSGLDPDPDGYGVTIDGAFRSPLAVDDPVTISRLTPGSHVVALTGASPNCSAGDNPRAVTLDAGSLQPLSFAVMCVASTGVVEVTSTSSGVDVDPDGYTVLLDGGASQPIDAFGIVRFSGVNAGAHAITLAGVADNCSAALGKMRPVQVVTGGVTRDTARTSFAVACVAASGVVEVQSATTGIDLDPDGYRVQLDSGTPQPLGVSGIIRFSAVSGGAHTVTLSGVAGNCTVAANNPRTLQVTVGGATRDTARTTFQAACVAVTASLAISAPTSGTYIDADGYQVQVDGGAARALAVNGTVTVDGLGAGTHAVRLGGVATSCAVGGGETRSVQVSTGGPVRDTVRTAFAVTCVPPVRVTVATTGDAGNNTFDFTADYVCDYYYRCTQLWSATLRAGDTATFFADPGDHWLAAAVPFGCTLAGSNPRPVTVTAGATTDVVFAFDCVAPGAVRVSAPTTGADADDFYRVFVDGGFRGYLPADSTVVIPLLPGTHAIGLGDVAANCAVSGGNPVSATVASGETTYVAFPVTCQALPVLRVSVVTTGTNLPDLYLVGVDPDYYYGYVYASSITPNGSTSLKLPPGEHYVYLDYIPGNCTVTTPDPLTIVAAPGATVDVGFAVVCR
jgi:hypothetical protein